MECVAGKYFCRNCNKLSMSLPCVTYNCSPISCCFIISCLAFGCSLPDWDEEFKLHQYLGKSVNRKTKQDRQHNIKDLTHSRSTAGTRWCFPWENLFLDRFCDFQTVFLWKTLKVLHNIFVFLWEKLFGNYKTCLKIGFSKGNTT